MPETTNTPNALTTAASLLATAALVSETAGRARLSVNVSGTEISIQVSEYEGDEAKRTAVVNAYAHILSTPVECRKDTWIETRGAIAGHPVHVWTVTDKSINRKEAQTTA